MTLTQQTAPYAHWEYLHPETGDRLRIIPERGGIVSEWRCGEREVLYFDQERYADPAKSIRGGIPVLFPICGNLPGDLLQVNGVDHTLKQHGFARNLSWQLQLLDDQRGVRLSLSSTDDTLTAYPFAFVVEMEVRSVAMALEISTTIHNRSDQPMPFSFGLHPYFNVSDLAKTRLTGLAERCLNHLEMADAATDEQLSCLPEGIDFLCRPAGDVTLIDDVTGAQLQLQHQEPMDLTVVWTEPPRKMVCLEPWTGPRQSLVSGDRKLVLEPGTQQTVACRYAVS
ncbi:aldose 1-epimerase family protein [Synechococcus sp. A15-24]|nr:aldose 1-epimerase family protein [Synechococcus sp. A15-24]